jgi:hypothetical protein
MTQIYIYILPKEVLTLWEKPTKVRLRSPEGSDIVPQLVEGDSGG